MTEYVSQIKSIRANRTDVYAKLSNLNNLSSIKERLNGSEYADKLNIEVIDEDACAIDVPKAGRVVFRIIDREQDKTIKLEAEASPVPLLMWIQLIEPASGDTRLRLTVHTELNFIMKKMVGSKLQEGVDRLADMLSMLPY